MDSVTVEYEFERPDGSSVQSSATADRLDRTHPTAGQPVVVLYLAERNFVLL